MALEDNNDDFDRHFFRSCNDHLVQQILCIKHNNSEVKCIKLSGSRHNIWDQEEWKRLGIILGYNKYVEELKILWYSQDPSELFTGLKMNKHYQNFPLLESAPLI